MFQRKSSRRHSRSAWASLIKLASPWKSANDKSIAKSEIEGQLHTLAIGCARHAHHVIRSANFENLIFIALQRIFLPVEILDELLVFKALLHQEEQALDTWCWSR